MADKWKVNEGTQVAFNDKMHTGGDTFSATEEEIAAEGLGAYVSKVKAQPAEKAQPAAESKAQQSSSNKAQQSSSNKST